MAGVAVVGNIPTITTAEHCHSLYSGTGAALATTSTSGTAINNMFLLGNQGQSVGGFAGAAHPTTDYRGYSPPFRPDHMLEQAMRPPQQQEIKMADPKRRLVKVIIIDPDDKVPLDKCVLYSGDEKLTDLTDQELFFEIEIKTLLEDHNFERTKLIDKSVKERMEHLEPVKVRDLRMVVVTVASF